MLNGKCVCREMVYAEVLLGAIEEIYVVGCDRRGSVNWRLGR